MILVSRFPEKLFGHNVEIFMAKDPSGAVLWANIEVNLIFCT
jgi:hypothetical protein